NTRIPGVAHDGFGRPRPCEWASPVAAFRSFANLMKFRAFTSTITGAALIFLWALGFAQTPEPSQTDAVRVTVTFNPDGSRTVYEFDNEHHKAAATTTEPDGKLRGKIRYELDAAGHFSSGLIFGPDEKF